MREHRRRDVDSRDALRAAGQGKGEPSHSAAEIERVGERDLPRQRRGDGRQQRSDVRLAGLEKRLRAAAAEVRLARQDGEVRLTLCELLPVRGMTILHLGSIREMARHAGSGDDDAGLAPPGGRALIRTAVAINANNASPLIMAPAVISLLRYCTST